jgi:Tfp pilus assembly protein PilZ
MEKRTSKRIPVNLDVNFACCSLLYYGTAKNISEKGMFISTKRTCFPFDLKFVLSLSLNKSIKLRLPVNLCWMKSSSDRGDSLGVELQSPSKDYMKFIEKLGIANNL